MAGMHRDKCGAAFVAGFFQVVNVYNCFISVTVLSLLFYIVYTYLDSFRNKSGKPQPIQTKVGKHAQLKGQQCPQNFGRDRLIGGKRGARTCPRRRVFCCQQYEITFRQLCNGRFSPNLAMTPELWLKRRFWTEIYEKFLFRGHLPPKPQT